MTPASGIMDDLLLHNAPPGTNNAAQHEERLKAIHDDLRLQPDVFFVFKGLALQLLVASQAEVVPSTNLTACQKVAIQFLKAYGILIWTETSARQHLVSRLRDREPLVHTATVSIVAESAATQPPKRPQDLFIAQRRGAVRQQWPGVNCKGIEKKLREQWRQMSEAEVQVHRLRFKGDKSLREMQSSHDRLLSKRILSDDEIARTKLGRKMRDYFEMLLRCDLTAADGTPDALLTTILNYTTGAAESNTSVTSSEESTSPPTSAPWTQQELKVTGDRFLEATGGMGGLPILGSRSSL